MRGWYDAVAKVCLRVIIICCGKLVGINVQLCTQIKVGVCFVAILMSFHMTKFGQSCVISVKHMDHVGEVKLCC